MTRIRTGVFGIALVALISAAGACGDDDDTEATSDENTSEEAAPAAASGSYPAVTEEINITGEGLTEECLAPQPLAEERTITFSTSAPLEFFSVPMLADHFGEFEAENINLEVTMLPPAESKQAVANSDLDVSLSAFDQPFYNIVNSGVDFRMALPNHFPNESNGAMFAPRDLFSDPDDPDLAELEGKTIAAPGGRDSGTAWATSLILEDAGLTVDDVEFVNVPVPDLLTSLETGAVDVAWVYAPATSVAEANDDLVALGYQEVPSTGYHFGPNLLNGDPEAGTAFIRAILRTQLKYMTPDYKSNQEVVAALAEIGGVDESVVTSGEESTFSYSFTENIFDSQQDFYLGLGNQLQYTEPLDFDDMADVGFLEAATAQC